MTLMLIGPSGSHSLAYVACQQASLLLVFYLAEIQILTFANQSALAIDTSMRKVRLHRLYWL